MSVMLHTSTALPSVGDYAQWFAVTGSTPALDAANGRDNLGPDLEAAFESSSEDWWRIGRQLSITPGGDLAHTPTCAPFVSDFGQCLAWARLVEDAAKADPTTLVVCDDPWLFRHLATIDGVSAGIAPGLGAKEVTLWVRGWASRIKVALNMFAAAITTRGQRRNAAIGAGTLLVYGHPRSTADGFDAYFGTLMREMPDLARVVHTDCSARRSAELAADGRTMSLHAWGNPLFALTLPFTNWRPASGDWLVRRAAALENATGSLAMTRWQNHCQQRWLSTVHPKSVAWSWENHPWEQEFVRRAKEFGIRTVGSQDTDVGRHQLNMSPASNRDGLDSIPSVIICNGPAYRDELLAWGIPEARLVVGGSYRIEKFDGDYYDAKGPVFVALSSNPKISTEMMDAVNQARNGTRTFVVKEHPMYPFAISETADIKRTDKTIPESPGISAVFFGTGLSGLEGLLSGTPTFRLLPSDRLGIDTLPTGCTAKAVSAEGFSAALDATPTPPHINWDDLFITVDLDVWRHHLSGSEI